MCILPIHFQSCYKNCMENKIIPTATLSSLPRSIELSGVTRSGDLNIDVKENVAYSVHGHHSRGSLPNPLIVVNSLAEGSVPQLQEGVYETIPGENEPDISPLDASYELISPSEPCDSDKPPEITYDVTSQEESP